MTLKPDANDELRAKGPAALSAAVAQARPMGPAAPASDLYTLEHLRRARQRKLLSVAAPGGWGDVLNYKIRGLAPGNFVLIGAARAKAGKTAFLAQLVDALSLRTADLLDGVEAEDTEPLSPVVVMSEMTPLDLAPRSLAREVGCDVTVFRAGRTAERWGSVDEYYAKAEALLTPPAGRVYRLLQQQQHVRALAAGSVVETIKTVVGPWRDTLRRKHPSREVWPIVAIDPFHRWLEPGAPELEAASLLAAELKRLADDEGLILLATADTNKDSARGRDVPRDPLERGASLMRGTYQLFHSADLVVYLDKSPTADENFDEPVWEVPLQIAANRFGGEGRAWYRWARRTGRFDPMTREECDVREKEPPGRGTAARNGNGAAPPALGEDTWICPLCAGEARGGPEPPTCSRCDVAMVLPDTIKHSRRKR